MSEAMCKGIKPAAPMLCHGTSEHMILTFCRPSCNTFLLSFLHHSSLCSMVVTVRALSVGGQD
jgi:hypothetical protein